MLLLSLSFGGVRFGGLTVESNSTFCAEPLPVLETFLGDDLALADRDVRFGGLDFPLSFSFGDVRFGGLDLHPIGCFDV